MFLPDHRIWEELDLKYIRQIAIIFCVTCMAEGIRYLLPFQIPASIYGLILLFGLLATKVIKVEDIYETANFLVEIMPVMFIPATVGLMDSWQALQSMLLPFIVIIALSTWLVMVITGKTAEMALRIKESRHK